MESLSRAMSGYPGRKNLIWLSTSFPVQLLADPKQENQPWRNSASYQSVLASAGALLAKSRIAVYPVDVRGLQGRGVDISNSAAEAGAWTGPATNSQYGDLMVSQTAAYSEERSTMRQVAEQTGGEAFTGTNNLKRAMQRSMEDGSIYYTLAYTPDKVDPQTAFHRIDVKIDHPDMKLAYRRGYYSSPAKPGSPQTGVAALRSALQPGMPPSTMLFMTASVLPPDATHKNVRIQYVINPNSVTFTDLPDQVKRITLDCIAIAYNNDGREVGHASDVMDGKIKAAAYETVMNNGIPAQQEINASSRSLQPATRRDGPAFATDWNAGCAVGECRRPRQPRSKVYFAGSGEAVVILLQHEERLLLLPFVRDQALAVVEVLNARQGHAAASGSPSGSMG